MINWKTVSLLSSIFAAGLIAGTFVGMRVACSPRHHQNLIRDRHDDSKRPVEAWSKRFQRDMTERVGVTAEQSAKLEPLVQQAQTDLRTFRTQAFQKMEEMAAQFDENVLRLLTEEQKPKYEQLVKERKERLKSMDASRGGRLLRLPGGEPPPPPPPPPDTPKP